jgi:hypothetical protein
MLKPAFRKTRLMLVDRIERLGGKLKAETPIKSLFN